MSWQLSQVLESDGQGIRSAAVLDDTHIITGTQGGSVVEYQLGPSIDLKIHDKLQHNHAITAMHCFAPNQISTGCKDSVVRLIDLKSQQIKELVGHDKAVTSLDSLQGYLASGSWDGTCKVWNLRNHSLLTTLDGHENTVSTCIVAFNENILTVCTGSAGMAQGNSIMNHAIRIYEINTTTGQSTLKHHVNQDHEGPIRDVCLADDDKILSCSNDGTVKIRNKSNGIAESTLVAMSSSQQHAPMLLSVIAINDVIVSCAEDGHVFFGMNTQSQQVQKHSACVWKVTALPNGDVATCAQDGKLRIFTQDTDRINPQLQQAFDEEAQASAAQKGPSAEEIAKLPKWETALLTNPGKSEGQVQVFNKGGIAIAAQWSMVSGTWVEVGQVMGQSSDDSGGGIVDGQQYDVVLPIEVDTPAGDVAKLQIGYNTGENPFVAAQRFLDTHQLPQHHLQDIADYITQRTGGGDANVTLGASSTSTKAKSAPSLMLEHLPMQGFKSFALSSKNAQATLDKIKSKVLEQDASEQAAVDGLVAVLLDNSSQTIPEAGLQLVVRGLQTWPDSHVFAALDLARLTVLVPAASSMTQESYWQQVIALALAKCQSEDPTSGVAIPMLSLRLFANCFQGGPGSLAAISKDLSSILTCADRFGVSSNKNVRLSAATVLLNVASHLCSSNKDRVELVPIVARALERKGATSETVTRLLLALGTAILDDDGSIQVAKTLYLKSKVEMIASPNGNVAKAVAKEIYQILDQA